MLHLNALFRKMRVEIVSANGLFFFKALGWVEFHE